MAAIRLSILMPVFNEAGTLRSAVRAVLDAALPGPIEVIVVDDGSDDATPRIIEELAAIDPRIVSARHRVNRGKGSAIRTAIEHMTGEIAFVYEADLACDPAEIAALVAPIIEGRADAVFGSRRGGVPERRTPALGRAISDRIVTLVASGLGGLRLTDVQAGVKAVRADILRRIPLRSDRFGFDCELATRLVQWGARIYEVPVSDHARARIGGSRRGWKDAAAAIGRMLLQHSVDRRFTTHRGYYIMRSFPRERGFRRWLLGRVAPFIGRRVYEAGCGIGNVTELLLGCDRVVCADLDPFCVESTRRRFDAIDNVTVRQEGEEGAGGLASEQVDTVLCLNVIEHVHDDSGVLRRYFDMLSPGGHAIILAPANPALYTACDRALGHLRRYTDEELRRKVREAGFELVEFSGFNRFGALGWWFNGVLGRDQISPAQLRAFGMLLPLARIFDAIRLGPALNYVAVGKKPAAGPAAACEIEPKLAMPRLVV